MQIIIQDHTFIFQVEYSKRKKFYLHISPEGHLTVKAPSNSSEEDITTFLESESKKLLSLKHKQENTKTISRCKSYTECENFLFLGKIQTLSELLPDYDLISNDIEAVQLALKKMYTKETKSIIAKRVKHYEKIINVNAKTVTIVDSPKTWGTCNNNRALTFNYRLSMAPIHVIDYVVIHELCHLLHLNHDRSFWRKVGMYDKNYKEHENYLTKIGGVMTI
ncbi:MAG: M48 family metallopeptidase [Cellulosilyticaceae bacterium]